MATLFVSDLDGTLLRRDATLGTGTLDLLNRLIVDGALFSYATARSHLSASRAIAGLGLRLPVAVYAGAAIVALDTGAVIVARDHDREVVREMLALCRAAGIPPLVYCRRDGADRVVWVRGAESTGIRGYLSTRGADPRFAPVDSWDDLPLDEVFYLTAIGSAAALDALRVRVEAALAGRLHLNVQRDTYSPHDTWLELSAAGADKATAVLRLKELAGAARLVVFGDNLNDLPMFAVADESYAVAGAAAAVREAATAVIPDAEEDAVALTIARLRGRGR